MKRILLAAIISLGLHGLLFSMETRWLGGINLAIPESREITISLAYQQPQKPPTQFPSKPNPKQVHQKKTPVQPKNILVKTPDIKNTDIPVESETLPKLEKSKPVNPDKEASFDPAPVLSQTLASTSANQKSIPFDAQTIMQAKPVYRINPPPLYPKIARKRGYQGNVVLEVLIDKQGKVTDLRVYSSSGHSILDKAATASVKKWLFQPGMRGSEKIEMWVRVPIRFRLN
jgi:protein TonB